MFETSRRTLLQAVGLGGAASIAGCASMAPQSTTDRTQAGNTASPRPAQVDTDTVAADPTDIPDPVDWDEPRTHEVELTIEEVTAEVEPGVTFDYMTFDGQVPGPMIRVRRGDTVELTVTNAESNDMPHNVDLHAVYGTGGGAVATMAAPGESNSMSFQARYPGSFIYHCAVPNLDYHISAGMFGMILVEPEDGLAAVDNEYYFGQHELYTDKAAGTEGHHAFDFEAMAKEEPTYVVLNGEKFAYAAAQQGPLQAQTGETARVYLVDGGPNVTSNFHPIGNVWTNAWPNGAVESPPDRFVQTMKVAPGSCFVGEMDLPVPERIKLVDHALSRVVRKGMLAEIDVSGEEQEDVYDPDFGNTSHEGPIYG